MSREPTVRLKSVEWGNVGGPRFMGWHVVFEVRNGEVTFDFRTFVGDPIREECVVSVARSHLVNVFGRIAQHHADWSLTQDAFEGMKRPSSPE